MSVIKILFIIFTIMCYNNNYLNVLCDMEILILHNNDMHSHLEETSVSSGVCQNKMNGQCYGGFARIKKTVEDIRKKEEGEKRVLFLNAGDTFQGTPYYTIFKWKVIAEFIDDLGIDVMSLGNHEFDDSVEGLVPYLKSIKTISVTANIDITDEPTLNVSTLKPYKILDLNGTKIAIIGYLTPLTKSLEDTGKIKFINEVDSLNEQVKNLKAKGINIFIALGHSGYNIDLEIAKNVLDIDLVIGGHTNTFLYNGDPPSIEKPLGPYPTVVTQESGRKVPVVQAYAYTKYLGYLNVIFDDNGEVKNFSGNPLLLDRTYPQDENMLSRINLWSQKIQNTTTEIVGVTKVLLNAHNYACKLGECNLGDLITDAFVDYNARLYEGEGWTDASIGIYQAGGIRTSIDTSASEGKITFGDIMSVLPFENNLIKGKILGKYLLAILEYAVHRYEVTEVTQVGEFLQMSGLLVRYDITKPPGGRVVSVKTLCDKCLVPVYSDLDPNKEYTIITSSYLKNGGDNYSLIHENLFNVTHLNVTDTDAVADYIRRKTPIYPKITNRIRVFNDLTSTTSIKPTTEGHRGSATNLEYINSLLLFLLSLLFIQYYNNNKII